MKRRTLIQSLGFGALALQSAKSIALAAETPGKSKEYSADVAIIGGGISGVSAAIGAARNGLRVILTEETDWIGGEFTSQALSQPDEHPWIDSFGGTRTYREFRHRLRDYYCRNFPLTQEARAKWNLNPGNADVSALSYEPRVGLSVLYEMLAPYLGAGRITILTEYKPVAADTDQNRVTAITLEHPSGKTVTVSAPYIIEATELGEVLELAKVESITGAESRKETGELHAAEVADPASQQAFVCNLVMEYIDGEDHTIEKPEKYDFWKSYRPNMNPPWPGAMLSWEYSSPRFLRPWDGSIDPSGKRLPRSLPWNSSIDPSGKLLHPRGSSSYNLWYYRRIADQRNFVEGTYRGDMSVLSWPQNEYFLGNLVGVTPKEAEHHVHMGKQLSLSYLYWMQTEAPRVDGGIGWRGLRLRKDVVDTEDGLAKYPYIQEARRVRAEFTVLEKHVGTEARAELTGKKPEEVTAEEFFDTIGVGSYRIDIHPTTRGINYIDISSLPFQIPLGALIPKRVENILATSKSIGTTHVTSGCYREHPTEWNIGESAGVLVAFCLEKKATPRQVRNDKRLLSDLQSSLQAQGVELRWPQITPL